MLLYAVLPVFVFLHLPSLEKRHRVIFLNPSRCKKKAPEPHCLDSSPGLATDNLCCR